MATNTQLAKIHIAKKELALTDLIYRDFLRGMTGKESARDLSAPEVGKVLDEFKRMGWKEKKRSRPAGTAAPEKLKYEDLANRDGMASPKQLRMIEAMWVTGPKIRDKSEQALRHFLQNRFLIFGLRFIESHQVGKIVRSIKSINQGKTQ